MNTTQKRSANEDTGLRVSELCALRWRTDVNWDSRTITVSRNMVNVKNRDESDLRHRVQLPQNSTKSAAGRRTLVLNDVAFEALSQLHKLTGKSEYVLSTKNGKPVSPRNLDRLFRCVQSRVGIPQNEQAGLHSLRHTFATRLFDNGVDIKTISRLLGHSDVTVTMKTYVHRAEKSLGGNVLPVINFKADTA